MRACWHRSLFLTLLSPATPSVQAEVDDDRGVVGEALVVGGSSIDGRLARLFADAGGAQQVVDAPAGVVVEGLAAHRPPGIGPRPGAAELATEVGPAQAVEPAVEVGDLGVEHTGRAVVVGLPVLDVDRPVDDVDVAPDDHLPLPRDRLLRQLGEARRDLDRKSTRLNSSHVAISYAVFCLKKKKTHERRSTACEQ